MLSVHAEELHNCAEENYDLAFSCLEIKYIFMNDVILALIIYFPNVFNSLLYESE